MARTRKTTVEAPQEKIVIGYIRISKYDSKSVSLAAQEERILAWARYAGFPVRHIYCDEGLSGSSMRKRHGIQQAMDAVCSARGTLVVYAMSRLARNTREALEMLHRLEESGATLVSCTESLDTSTPSGRMAYQMLCIFAEFERQQLIERTQCALDLKRARQEKLGGKVPYGMQFAPDGKHLEVNHAEQVVIAKARTLHATRLSLRKIAAALAVEGHLSREEKPFTPQAIANMIED